jgi:hypothetical protein
MILAQRMAAIEGADYLALETKYLNYANDRYLARNLNGIIVIKRSPQGQNEDDNLPKNYKLDLKKLFNNDATVIGYLQGHDYDVRVRLVAHAIRETSLSNLDKLFSCTVSEMVCISIQLTFNS